MCFVNNNCKLFIFKSLYNIGNISMKSQNSGEKCGISALKKESPPMLKTCEVLSINGFSLVAEAGFEPATSGL